MKLFLVSLLAAAAVAQPQWPMYPGATMYAYPGQYVPGTFPVGIHPATTMYTMPMVKPVMPVMKHHEEKKEDDMVEVYSADKKMMMEQEHMKPHHVKPQVYAHNTVVLKDDTNPMKVTEYEPEPFTFNTIYKTMGQAKYHAKNGEVEHTVYKRSADSYFNPYLYSGVYSHYQTPYTHGYAHGYAHPYAHPYQYVQPKTYANDAIRPEQYAAKGQYAAITAGSAHFAKRDADADPAVIYSSPFGYSTGFPGYTASTFGYPTYTSSIYGYNYPQFNYGYGRRFVY